jgi:hypothetical protein
MRDRLRNLLLATVLLCGPAALAAEPPTPEDYLRILTDGPWPLEILAFCYATIDHDPALQATGKRWRARNDGLLATVAAKAGDIVPADVRRQADEASLAAIRRLAARQYDKPAWCRTLAQVIDSGAYDIDRRSDLEAPLKRIFGRD